MDNYRFKFPELYQFFGGYFYQGWSADYRWDSTKPNYSAVILHFKAVNPLHTINKVSFELEELIRENLNENQLEEVLTALGSNFYPQAEEIDYRHWLENISMILRDSPAKARVLRELR